MLKSFTLFMLMMSTVFSAQAACFPAGTEPVAEEQTVKKQGLDIAAMERMAGRKFSLLERWQLKHMQKQLAKGKKASPLFPERDYLTEGFLPLPFFGSLLTLGLLHGVLLFTARDANVLRWSGWGAGIIWLIFTVVAVIALLSGY